MLFNQVTNVVPAYAPFLFSAYNGYLGWGRATSEVFKSPYHERIDGGLFDGDTTMETINGQLNMYPTNLYQATFSATSTAAARWA